MTELHTIPILIEYSSKDCKRGNKWLIKDIATDIAKTLVKKIDKPIKATLLITYFGLKNDKHRNRGQTGKQSSNNGNGVQVNKGCSKGNTRTKKRN